jgi:PIN domain nuclease of toxin-antitoxin system
MRVLVDTHALLWYLEGNSRLSYLALNTIENKENKVLVSIVSIWEIAIKIGLGKLALKRSFKSLQADLKKLDIEILHIEFSDTNIYLSLPLYHRDPFDRILIAQSLPHPLAIISCDPQFQAYPIQILW